MIIFLIFNKVFTKQLLFSLAVTILCCMVYQQLDRNPNDEHMEENNKRPVLVDTVR